MTFWYFAAPLLLIWQLTLFIDAASLNIDGQVGHCSGLLLFVVAIPAWSIAAKRCRDRGHPNWYLFLWFIPIIGPLWLLIELGLRRGTLGPNKYGPDPLTPRDVRRMSLELAPNPPPVGAAMVSAAPRKAPAKRSRKKGTPTIPC